MSDKTKNIIGGIVLVLILVIGYVMLNGISEIITPDSQRPTDGEKIYPGDTIYKSKDGAHFGKGDTVIFPQGTDGPYFGKGDTVIGYESFYRDTSEIK